MAGVTVDTVDWLPSGTRTGLVRVRGRREADALWELPVLVLERAGETQRFTSLPDTRDRDPAAWRGAYVVDVAVAAAATGWWAEWPNGSRLALARPEVPLTPAPEPPPPPDRG